MEPSYSDAKQLDLVGAGWNVELLDVEAPGCLGHLDAVTFRAEPMLVVALRSWDQRRPIRLGPRTRPRLDVANVCGLVGFQIGGAGGPVVTRCGAAGVRVRRRRRGTKITIRKIWCQDLA